MFTDPIANAGQVPLPPIGLNLVGSNMDDPVRSIVLSVQDAIERRLLAGAFEALKWVVAAHASLWASIQDSQTPTDPTIVLLYRPKLVVEAREHFGQSDIVVLADGTEEAVAEAWASGPDWVITRPIDPSDPLGASSS